MELNRVSEKKMVALFGLATISEIRDYITSITDRYRNSWEDFSHALKDEYLEDANRVTKKLFLGWIERPNKNLQATELLREFERQYSQLSKVEKLTLEPNKVDLFLQAADGELQEKLEPLLEDKEEDEGLTTKWKNVEDAVGLLTKKERRKDRNNIPKTVQAPKAPVRTTPPTMPTVQLLTSLSKKADMGMEEIIQGMRDLQIKLARLEENTSINNSNNVSKQGYVQRCIWCDDASHTRKDCNEFNNMIRQGIICWKDEKIALKDREDLLQTNFGKGGMRALVQDYLKGYETVARESASYGARVDDEIGGSTETSEFWASAVSTMQEEKLPREALLRTAATIRGRTGWEDPVESLSVHAYIAKSQHEALMEEKRRGNFDDTRGGNSSKRQT
uniref:Predicted protein n=1 Tax=Physcomitrium patens TaxID=3218 RepID=A9U4K6_PHYPA